MCHDVHFCHHIHPSHLSVKLEVTCRRYSDVKVGKDLVGSTVRLPTKDNKYNHLPIYLKPIFIYFWNGLWITNNLIVAQLVLIMFCHKLIFIKYNRYLII